MKQLVIFGSGGVGREILTMLNEAPESTQEWSVLAFLDDDRSRHGMMIQGIEVMAPDQRAFDRDVHFALAIGMPAPRRRVTLKEKRTWATIRDHRSRVGPTVAVGIGSVIKSDALLTTDITTGSFVLIDACARVAHDVVIADYATIGANATVCGGVDVGEGAFVGPSATIIPGVRIGRWSIVGAGATVIRDVPANAVVAGVPARLISQREEGWHAAECLPS